MSPSLCERGEDIAERRLHEGDAIAKAGEARLRGGERDVVAIERDHARGAASFEDPLRVTTAADRRIDEDAAVVTRRERVDDLREHHGLVDEVAHLDHLSSVFVAPHPLAEPLVGDAGQMQLRTTGGVGVHRPSSAKRVAICARSSSETSNFFYHCAASHRSAYLPLPAHNTSFFRPA